MNSSVYFLECAGKIKIGFSRNVDGRLRSLSTGAPSPLKVLAVVDGSQKFERAIHTALHKFRHRGEWFDDCFEVRSLMRKVVAEGYRAIGFVEPKRTPPEQDFEDRVQGEIVKRQEHDPIEDHWDAMHLRIEKMQRKIGELFLVRKLETLAGLPKDRVINFLADGVISKENIGKALDCIEAASNHFHNIHVSAVRVDEDGNEFVLAQASAVLSHMESSVQSLLKFRDIDADLQALKNNQEVSRP